jgi:ribonucleoside-diphosphate reductase alpha chain
MLEYLVLRNLLPRDGVYVQLTPERPQEDMPVTREGKTHKVHIAGQAGYITMNRNEDETLREVFIHGFGKIGSVTQGWTDSFAIMLSLWLQEGHGFDNLAKRFAYLRFEPNGETDNPKIPTCHSIPHYILRLLALEFGDDELNAELDAIDEEMRRP